MNLKQQIPLSLEQELFVQKALEGYNILVNACIGSGKTTAIQLLCDRLPRNYKILYLTYNKLLKIDAQSKIRNRNTTVTNYHGFAYKCLKSIGIKASVQDLIGQFNTLKPPIALFDVLIIDEYQDIEQELSVMLEYIKSSNENIQIIAVGDMEQKIYDKTALKVSEFIEGFLEQHIDLEFTQCFRLSTDLAAKLGRIWNKTIVGVNKDCKVEEMRIEQVVEFLSFQQPKDILCLGARNGELSNTLNILETEYSGRFNKQTVYASISDNDSLGSTQPTAETAIFTTFDSSKGLERKICVIFDFTESYWDTRISKPLQSYEILRNIFCVAASRGKEHIIFVRGDEAMLDERTLSTNKDTKTELANVDISKMFDFKYKEDIEGCFSLLHIQHIPVEDNSVITAKFRDGMIDLSPCIGIYQEAMFFNDYSIDAALEQYFQVNTNKKYLWNNIIKNSELEKKILFLVSMETNQDRYRAQVELPFISQESADQIAARLSTRLSPDNEVQISCQIHFAKTNGGSKVFSALGFADAVKDGVVYELKFVSELAHEHFLQCACYIVALGLEKGILWNTRDNTVYEVTVPDKAKFMDAVANTVTKNVISRYYEPRSENIQHSLKNKRLPELPDISEYCTGTKIIHKTNGKGTIIDIEDRHSFHIITVIMENGVKRSFSLEILLQAGLISIDPHQG